MNHEDDLRKSIELGIPSIDAEHGAQLERMRRLGAAIREGAPAERLGEALEGLIGYLDAHFLSEQITMREHAYPDYEAHVHEHDHAVSILQELRGRILSGDVAVSDELLRSLDGWLVAHIHSADRRLAEYLRSRGGGAS